MVTPFELVAITLVAGVVCLAIGCAADRWLDNDWREGTKPDDE